MVASAVAGDTVSRIISSLADRDDDESTENMERLEMAHIKMEAVLHMTEKWQIPNVPLLRWRSKLKRAAQECGDELQRCKQRVIEGQEIRLRVSQSSFPKRIAYATKSFISSITGSSNDESSSSTDVVRRFERFADGANEFLKFVEFSGTPRKYMFFNHLINNLLRGKSLRYRAFQGSKFYYLRIRPMSSPDRGVEAMVAFVYQDFKEPTKAFRLRFMLRLSESTNVFGVISKCMQSVAPHFKFAAEGVMSELTQLPTQDFSWETQSPCGESTYWVNVYNTLTQQFRPNPLCCHQHEQNLSISSRTNNTASSSRLLSILFPEEVISVLLQCHVAISDKHKYTGSSAAEHKGSSYVNSHIPPLKLGVLFLPHDSPEDIETDSESYALEVIGEEVQAIVHRNACLQDIDEKLLPKAIDYLYQNKESKMYRMCLKSRHGTANLCVEKTSARGTMERCAISAEKNCWYGSQLETAMSSGESPRIRDKVEQAEISSRSTWEVGNVTCPETVSQVLSGLVQMYDGKEKLNANKHLERLEMAHIKLEAALGISNTWIITDASLLRWRKKLKRATQECDNTLRKCKERILEKELMEQEVRNSNFPKRIAHATKSFIFSVFTHNDNDLSRSIVQRFEWFADGASEFLRFIELGGTPRRHMPFNSIIRHLFVGKELQHKIFRGKDYPSILLSLVPFSTAEHGMEACLKFIHKDSNAPENNFILGVMLQISESTDIIGIVVKCLQLFPPHFQPIVEAIRKELTQLPTQDFSWVPYVDLWHRKHWENLHSFSTQWFRPDPLCCKQHDQKKLHNRSSIDMVGLPDVSLDSIIEISLQCQVSLSKYNKQHTSLPECENHMPQYLKAGFLFSPHGSSKDKLPEDRSSAISAIFGEDQHCIHTDVTLEQLNETVLPKAMDYFCRNTKATVYQMLWKSKHGTEYIDFEKGTMEMPSVQRTSKGARKRKLDQKHVQDLRDRNRMLARFVNSWVAHAPVWLQGTIMDWIQKEKETHYVIFPQQGRNTTYASILMAEIVSSAVAQETISQILSGLVQKYEEKEKPDARTNLERLEMAHIRLEAALETSEKWQITDGSLLRWRKKLKRAAQECDDTLHKYKHIILEKEQIEQEVSNSSLPNQIVHATKSFALAIFNRDNRELSRSVVKRFEWFADGASEFLRFIELGGTPHCHVTFHSLNKHLFAGKELYYKIVHGKGCPCLLLWLMPFKTADHRIEVVLIFIHKDTGIVFAPHGSSEDMLHMNKTSPMAAIVSGEQNFLHTDITLEQVEKASMRTRRTLEGTRKTKVLQGQGQEFRSRTELVSTAIVQETVSHIISGLAQKFEDNEESNANRNMERLEMAHIRLEAALATSDKWKITDASLLRWRRKLKRAAQECNDTLHKCKQRIIEDEQIEWEDMAGLSDVFLEQGRETLHGCTEIKHENTENFWGC
ncbi:hypothetical protein HU200_027946 [Digitaria exilis]|uniref:Uncharacterized protein n=1 Tax=Digitaria exilis TaxID=1010633 RepID=A0A835C6J0_9POAL|nr:hypothetical protein HU200_027946 [Digitaria exilis]